MLLVVKGLDVGGLERVVVDLALGLDRRGIVVDLAVVNGRRLQMAPLLEGSSVRVEPLGGSDLIGLSATRQLARLCRSGRHDLIHVHGPLPTVLTRIASSVPVVATAHAPWVGLRAGSRTMWRATAFRDAATLAVSAGVASSLPPPIAARTRVLPHGIDPAAVAVARRTARTRPEGSSEVLAVCVANHWRVKNYPNLLEALRLTRRAGHDVRLTAVGQGPELERNQALARDLGLESAVTFEGPLPSALQAIAAADVLVVASDSEGQPLVIAEALALGRPVVSTAVGRAPELLDDEVGRVVAPQSPEALAAALSELAADPDLLCRLGEAAQARRHERTVDDVIDDHLDVYADAIGRA